MFKIKVFFQNSYKQPKLSLSLKKTNQQIQQITELFEFLEKLMYDKLHNYLITNKIFFSKQFGFGLGWLLD